MIKTNNQAGFAHIIIPIVAIVLVIAVGFVAWQAFNKPKAPDNTAQQPASTAPPANDAPSELLWQQGEGGWRTMSAAPDCPAQPMMKAPADLTKATGVLYPGQTRGGNYKPHGGFRFDGSKNADIKVTAPIDGFIVRGGSYIAEDTVQYTLDIMNNCGVMYRLGHFAALPANLQKIADTWPAPSADSRTQMVNALIYFTDPTILNHK